MVAKIANRMVPVDMDTIRLEGDAAKVISNNLKNVNSVSNL